MAQDSVSPVNTNDQSDCYLVISKGWYFDPDQSVATLTSNFTNYGDIFFLVSVTQ